MDILKNIDIAKHLCCYITRWRENIMNGLGEINKKLYISEEPVDYKKFKILDSDWLYNK